jgi:hypothetical protein
MFRHIRLMCVLTLSAFALSAQVAPPHTVQTTAIVGIADAQTARLNLLNPGVQAPAVGVVCTAMVQFADAKGNVLKNASVTVIPGQSQSVDLHSDTDLSLAVGDRRQIRATISIPAVPPPSGSASTAVTSICKLIPTLEIFDTASGRTQAVLGHVVSID